MSDDYRKERMILSLMRRDRVPEWQRAEPEPPTENVWEIAERLQVALDAHAEAVGPMVVANRATREISLSFELDEPELRSA